MEVALMEYLSFRYNHLIKRFQFSIGNQQFELETFLAEG